LNIQHIKSLSLQDIFELILDKTSELTGYPKEILNLDQDLEC